MSEQEPFINMSLEVYDPETFTSIVVSEHQDIPGLVVVTDKTDPKNPEVLIELPASLIKSVAQAMIRLATDIKARERASLRADPSQN